MRTGPRFGVPVYCCYFRTAYEEACTTVTHPRNCLSSTDLAEPKLNNVRFIACRLSSRSFETQYMETKPWLSLRPHIYMF